MTGHSVLRCRYCDEPVIGDGRHECDDAPEIPDIVGYLR